MEGGEVAVLIGGLDGFFDAVIAGNIGGVDLGHEVLVGGALALPLGEPFLERGGVFEVV